jgi:hypothetical protein
MFAAETHLQRELPGIQKWQNMQVRRIDGCRSIKRYGMICRDVIQRKISIADYINLSLRLKL